MRKSLKQKLTFAFLVGNFLFLPNIYDMTHVQAEIQSEIQTYEGVGRCMFDFGEDDEKMVNAIKERAKQRAEQAAKDKAGVYLVGYSRSQNFQFAENEIATVTNDIVEVLDVTYKRLFYEAHSAKGESYGEVGIMYEATVKVKINTSGIQKYINRDAKEKSALIEQEKLTKQRLATNDAEFEKIREKATQAKTKNERIKLKEAFYQNYEEFLAIQQVKLGNEVLQRGGNESEAIKYYNKAIKLNPQCIEAYSGRAYAYEWSLPTNNQAALNDYNKLIELKPDYSAFYCRRGFFYYFRMKDNERALADYNKAIELNENYMQGYSYSSNDFYGNNSAYKYSQPYAARGWIYKDLKDYTRAIADFQKAIELNPKDDYSYENIGDIYFALKNYNLAVENYVKSFEIKPHYSTADRIAHLYKELKETEKAAHYLNWSYDYQLQPHNLEIEKNPDDYKAYSKCAAFYSKNKKYTEAVNDYTKAIELSGGKYFFEGRALIYIEMKNYNLALQDFNKEIELELSKKEPNEYALSKYYLNRGRCHKVLGNNLKAREDFLNSIEIESRAIEYWGRYPENHKLAADHYKERGLAYIEIEDYNKAISDFTKAIEQKSYSLGDCYYYRGKCYQMLGDTSKAESDLAEAKKIGTSDKISKIKFKGDN